MKRWLVGCSKRMQLLTQLWLQLSWINAMTKPLVSYRRIDQLKTRAFDCGFTNEDAKQFGKLSKTATWEALLSTYGIPSQVVDSVDSSVDSDLQSLDTSGWTNDGSFPACNFTRPNSSLLDWGDFGPLVP